VRTVFYHNWKNLLSHELALIDIDFIFPSVIIRKICG